MKTLFNVSPILSMSSLANKDEHDYSSFMFDFASAKDGDEYQLIEIRDYEYKHCDYMIGRQIDGDKHIIVIRKVHNEPFAPYDQTTIGPFTCDGGRHLAPGKAFVIQGSMDNTQDIDGVFAHSMTESQDIINIRFAPYTPVAASSSDIRDTKPLKDLQIGRRGVIKESHKNYALDVWIHHLKKDGMLENIQKIKDLKTGAKARYEILESRNGTIIPRKILHKELLQYIDATYGRSIHFDFINDYNKFPELLSLDPSAFAKCRKKRKLNNVTKPTVQKTSKEVLKENTSDEEDNDDEDEVENDDENESE